MLREFLLPRIGSALVVIFGVATLVFLLIHIVPGDPVEVLVGEAAPAADREAMREALGLDQPIGRQLMDYYGGLLRLDMGASFHTGRPVVEEIASRLPATIELAAAGLLVAILLAFPLGIVAALYRNTWVDYTTMGFSMLGVSIPNFWLGPVLILIFALWLGWLPVSGREGVASVILPAVTLGTALAAILARMVRSALLETLSEEYVRTARAKGLSRLQVIVRHALRNAMLPVVTLLGLQLGALLGGTVITETVFSWPGIGLLTIEAIQRRDYPVLQGCVLLISVAYVLINTFTDLVYSLLDPRIRYGAGG